MRFLIAFLSSILFHLLFFIKTNLGFQNVVLMTATSDSESKMFASIIIQESVERKEKKKSVEKKEEKKVVKKDISLKKKEITKKKEQEKEVKETKEEEVNQVKSKSLPNAYTSKTRMAKAADYLNNPHPKYPLLALRRNQEGTVTLKVKVDKSGKVVSLSIKGSSGYSLLDNAATKSVKSWIFAPATLSNGDKVASTVIVPIEYKLR